MILNELVGKLHMSTKVLIHMDGEDMELTPRILANHGKRDVLEIGIVGESVVEISNCVSSTEKEELKTAREPEMTWLHVTLGEVKPPLVTAGLNGITGCGYGA